jgi:hypothetical protein
MRNVSEKSEKIRTYFLVSNIFPENLAVYKIMWGYMAEPDRSYTAHVLCVPET